MYLLYYYYIIILFLRHICMFSVQVEPNVVAKSFVCAIIESEMQNISENRSHNSGKSA